MSETNLRKCLAELPVAQLRYFETTTSTNDEAVRWAASGAADSSIVVADEQTAGRGRLQRHWVTRPGVALAFSLIFLPTRQEAQHLALFSPLAALALSDALLHRYGLASEVKWPNDVLIGRRKTAGILVEAAWMGSEVQSVVVGVGVNVAPQAVPPADELIFPATSVEEQLGRAVERFELLCAVLERIFAWRPRLGSEEFLQAWQDRLAFKGEWVEVQQTGLAPVHGKVKGIDAGGNLLLLLPGDDVLAVAAGDVRLRPLNNDQSA